MYNVSQTRMGAARSNIHRAREHEEKKVEFKRKIKPGLDKEVEKKPRWQGERGLESKETTGSAGAARSQDK